MLIITIVICFLYIHFKRNLPIANDVKEEKVFNNFNKLNDIFYDRYILHKDNEFVVGKNKNEVENGYFDFKINVNDSLEITLNKIFKSFDEKYNNIYFNTKYFDDIFMMISYFGYNVTSEVKNKCMDEYIKVRTSCSSYNIDKYAIENVDIFTKDNMLCLNIHK